MIKRMYILILGLIFSMTLFSDSYEQIKSYLHTYDGSIHFYYNEHFDKKSFSSEFKYIVCNKGTSSIWIYGKYKDEYVNIVNNSLITPDLYKWMKMLNIVNNKMSIKEKNRIFTRMINLIFREEHIKTVDEFKALKETNSVKYYKIINEPDPQLLKIFGLDKKNIHKGESTYESYRSSDIPVAIVEEHIEEIESQDKLIIYSYTKDLESLLKRREFILNKHGEYILKSENIYMYGFMKPDFVHFEEKFYYSN